ncbi:hypothetical protein GY03_01315 [Proteus vulgaris]|uniref:hypothetical protein n=1 Tax=Proteus vulgaris TaxID=585 RepID=UPI0021B0A416|nr:hypothetical protein [Proteus vulgaris]MCT6515925.1 hypothetical protein [Proteus vulgaris]
MKKRQWNIILIIKLSILWVLKWIPFLYSGGVINSAIDEAYQLTLNDYRNKKIDKKNAEMKEKGINIKNLNKKL